MRVRALVATLLLLPLGVSSLAAQAMGIREVTASERSLIQLNTKIRYTTMIVLPEGEEILDVVCGDKDFWVISATQNIAHVKPAKEGAAMTGSSIDLVRSALFQWERRDVGKTYYSRRERRSRERKSKAKSQK